MPESDATPPTPRVNPKDVARQTFEVARRGYDQQAVRAYLHELALVIDGLVRTEGYLRDELDRRPTDGSPPPVLALDESSLMEQLGEETARVLTSARAAAAEIRDKAEVAASRTVEDAVANAARTRADAVEEADRRLQEAKASADALLLQARNELAERTKQAEAAAAAIVAEGEASAQVLRDQGQAELAKAQAEAEEILEAARIEGREMVSEAQTVRERVLRDLASKRKKARSQIEQLNAGRERLLEAYDVVRSTIDTATTELELSVRDAKRSGEAASRRVASERDEDIADLDAEVAAADLGGLPIVVNRVTKPARPSEEPTVEREQAPVPVPEPAAAVVAEPDAEPVSEDGSEFGPIDLPGRPHRIEQRAVRTPPVLDPLPSVIAPAVQLPEPEPVIAAHVVVPEPEPEPASQPELVQEQEPVVATVVDVAPAAPVEPPAVDPRPEKKSKASAVFARLHEVEKPAAAAEEPTPEPDVVEDPPARNADEEAFRHRAEVLEPIQSDLLRLLKRTLADEQNEVLDVLRRERPADVDALLASPDDHQARWVTVVTASLDAAASAGASFVDGTSSSTADLATELAATLVVPLRERIDRSFEAADGDLDNVADRVKALYREWKIQRLPEIGPGLVVAAYARGIFDGTNKGAKVRWVVDPSRGPCPDCDDNVLAGVVVKGEAFPTGNQHAPAHPGCHCLVLVHEDVLLTD